MTRLETLENTAQAVNSVSVSPALDASNVAHNLPDASGNPPGLVSVACGSTAGRVSPAGRPRIQHLDFFGPAAIISLSRALAFREAWSDSIRYRAPVALRRSLRRDMRWWAQNAVKEVRFNLASRSA